MLLCKVNQLKCIDVEYTMNSCMLLKSNPYTHSAEITVYSIKRSVIVCLLLYNNRIYGLYCLSYTLRDVNRTFFDEVHVIHVHRCFFINIYVSITSTIYIRIAYVLLHIHTHYVHIIHALHLHIHTHFIHIYTYIHI